MLFDRVAGGTSSCVILIIMEQINIKDYTFLLEDFAIKSKIDNSVYLATEEMFNKIAKSAGLESYKTLLVLKQYDENFNLSKYDFLKNFYVQKNHFVYLSETAFKNISYLTSLMNVPQCHRFYIDTVKEILIYTLHASDISVTHKTEIQLNESPNTFKAYIDSIIEYQYIIENSDIYLESIINDSTMIEFLSKRKIIRSTKTGYRLTPLWSEIECIVRNNCKSDFEMFDFIDSVNLKTGYHKCPVKVVVAISKVLILMGKCKDFELADIFEKIHEDLGFKYYPSHIYDNT